jgi:16S rRNA C967 or C1407 C5-methylase (RsmB/RsmF family)/NOL1/NOP2/fmu family ribosome biogenesis protein
LQVSVPQALLDSLEGIPGFDRPAFLQAHTNPQPSVSIRLNPYKWKQGAAWQGFPRSGPIPWSSEGYYLAERPEFILDPLFHAGTYYVQEPSSMFLEESLKQTLDLSERLRVLDLCAAPGGKSTLIQSVLDSRSLLVSNEVIKSRTGALLQNLSRWGASNVIVTNNDASDFHALCDFFDAIVVDAPCSGSGMFRKEPESVAYWKEELVQLCQERQQRILAKVWPSLKKDGVLIYSTCSYSPDENEHIVDWMLNRWDAEPIRLKLDPGWQIVESRSMEKQGWGYRFYPYLLKGEGFYLACIRKNSGDTLFRPKKKDGRELLSRAEKVAVMPFLREEEGMNLGKFDDRIHLYPAGLESDYQWLKSFLYIRNMGTTIGRFAGKEWIPHHDLALSVHLSDKVPFLSAGREEAIRYLRKEELRIDPAFQGWGLIRYEGDALGWIKSMKNRINNYFPTDWRILKKRG